MKNFMGKTWNSMNSNLRHGHHWCKLPLTFWSLALHTWSYVWYYSDFCFLPFLKVFTWKLWERCFEEMQYSVSFSKSKSWSEFEYFRDLKPENILLNDEMHIQITDFGSAKILKDTKGDEGELVLGRYPDTPVVCAVTIPTPLLSVGTPLSESINSVLAFDRSSSQRTHHFLCRHCPVCVPGDPYQ